MESDRRKILSPVGFAYIIALPKIPLHMESIKDIGRSTDSVWAARMIRMSRGTTFKAPTAADERMYVTTERKIEDVKTLLRVD